MKGPRPPLTLGWEAAKANAIPALILQGAMLSILIAYYLSSTFADWLDRLAHYKQEHGVAFVVVAGILAGAVLPELFLIFFFQKGKLRPQNFRNLIFTVPTWAICVDQFGYNPFLAAPGEVLIYEWKNDGFSWRSVRRAFSWNHYRARIVPTLLATWAVWAPLMAIIYSLPYALQFPLFSLALTFWVLLLTYMTNRFAGKIEADALLALSVADQ